jgi:hypothetical protein
VSCSRDHATVQCKILGKHTKGRCARCCVGRYTQTTQHNQLRSAQYLDYASTRMHRLQSKAIAWVTHQLHHGVRPALARLIAAFTDIPPLVLLVIFARLILFTAAAITAATGPAAGPSAANAALITVHIIACTSIIVT